MSDKDFNEWFERAWDRSKQAAYLGLAMENENRKMRGEPFITLNDFKAQKFISEMSIAREAWEQEP